MGRMRRGYVVKRVTLEIRAELLESEPIREMIAVSSLRMTVETALALLAVYKGSTNHGQS
jgi:hypothetical protein